MTAADVVGLLDCLGAAGVEVWLDGGWAVDAALGVQTRSHDDLDVIVEMRHVKAVRNALARRGYAHGRGIEPMSFEVVDLEGRQVDVHPVVFNASGDGIYRMDDGEEWTYPAGGFEGTGLVQGRQVRCLTPEVQILCHTGYDPHRTSFDDVTALSRRFGLLLPDEYCRSAESYPMREES